MCVEHIGQRLEAYSQPRSATSVLSVIILLRHGNSAIEIECAGLFTTRCAEPVPATGTDGIRIDCHHHTPASRAERKAGVLIRCVFLVLGGMVSSVR